MKAKTGDFVQIPLGDGSFGYGKVLVEPEMAFLDIRTYDEEVDQEDLINAPILFRLWIMKYALQENSPWHIIGNADLSDREAVKNKYFKKDKLNGKLSIYHSGDQYPDRFKEWPATYEECVGLERAAVWDPEHVESRLLDHFEGRENKWVRLMSLDSK